MTQNTLMGISSPYSWAPTGLYDVVPTKDEILAILAQKYPKKASLLACIARKESTWCTQMHGDNGLAYGCYQIHIDKHPVSEECAMDFECSADFTYKKIIDGKGALWSTYPACTIETNQY